MDNPAQWLANSSGTAITDSGRNMAAGLDINVSGGSYTAQLTAQSITELISKKE